MAVKLTKNELKVQKDRLKQFQRYLPTLQLKKQQLQSVVMQVTAQLEKVEAERLKIVDGLDGWIAVFAENGSFPEGMRLDSLIRPKDVVCRDHNIAGVIVPASPILATMAITSTKYGKEIVTSSTRISRVSIRPPA